MVTGVRLVDKLANKRAPHVRIEAGRALVGFCLLSASFFFPCEVWFSNMSDTERVDQLQRSLEKSLGIFQTCL